MERKSRVAESGLAEFVQVNSNVEHHGQVKYKNENEADVRVVQSGYSFERRQKTQAKVLSINILPSCRTARPISFCKKVAAREGKSIAFFMSTFISGISMDGTCHV